MNDLALLGLKHIFLCHVEDRKTSPAQPRGSLGRNFKLFDHVMALECI